LFNVDFRRQLRRHITVRSYDSVSPGRNWLLCSPWRLKPSHKSI